MRKEKSWGWTPGRRTTDSAETRRRRVSSPPTGRSPTETTPPAWPTRVDVALPLRISLYCPASIWVDTT
ncbi:hypothetical protein P7K49_032399, partial [Saguinus oedipus]